MDIITMLCETSMGKETKVAIVTVEFSIVIIKVMFRVMDFEIGQVEAATITLW
jgi:hypothetical protein